MNAIDDPKTITLRRTQYSLTSKQTWRQRLAARFTEAAALASVAAVFAAVVISALEPALFPLPA